MTLLVTMALVWCGVSASAGFVLPQGLTDIADEAFMDTAVSYYLTIPEGVKTIGRQAFMGSRVLQVKLPASVTYIASDAFRPNTAFEVVPGSYAKQWCIDNGFFYDEMRVWVNVSYAVSYADNPAVLKATCAYPSQVDSYRWETSTDLKNWKVAQGQTGASFQADYSDSLQESYVRCRASVNGVLLDSANYATVTYKPGTIQFNAEKCKAVSGDAIYLEWTNMGTGMLYYLNQWIPDSTREQGGYWKVIASKLTAISYTVYDLEEDTEYYFALVAGPAEDDGRGLRYESDTISLTTLSDPYSFNINELRVEGTSCRVQWERVDGAYYKVEYIRNDRAPQIVSSRWSSEYIWLYGIPTNTDFSIRITAWVPDSRYTNNRFNIAVATKSARSGDFEPSITLDDITLTDGIAHLSWNALDGTTYTVYMSADGGQTSTPLAAELDTTYYDVSGLQGGKTYHFSVAAVCGSWKSTSEWLPVTIPDKSEGSIEYRALLIGEVSFKGTQYAARNYGDVELIASALSKARTPNGATYSVVRRKDLTANGICDAIWETFSDADEDDVSLLFIATHGDTYDMGQDAGYLSTVDPNGNQGYLDLYVLADELNRINGKVIVWLGSCGSGAAIYEHGVPQNGDEDFTANAMQAFSAYDDRNNAPVYVPSEFPGIAEEYETGEFRKEGKFYVLTAARYHQMSWGSEKERLNFFGKFLCEGITNTNGRMPADANGDDRVTQNELFRYIKSREEDDAEFINQNVQTYPQNSDYVLFVK